ncbi:MAG: beta-ketoacyl synthase chain length factor [Verrucomicrobia bacterium]|nr:beta-ketoacyl synthase chain length factor [Verrucomicrobiota bacterium]
MNHRYIHEVRVLLPEDLEQELALLSDLKSRLPRNAARRMSASGIMVSGVVPDDSAAANSFNVIYASQFAETVALEKYLTSLPEASPMLFQTSIHPSAVEQVWICRQRTIPHFIPMTATGSDSSALLTASFEQVLLSAGFGTTLVLAEERGTWMTGLKLASDRSFAAAIFFNDEADGAIGKLFCSVPKARETKTFVSVNSLLGLTEAVMQRKNIVVGTSGFSNFALQWN